MIKIITASELKKKLINQTVSLIDVREPAEHNLKHIPGSILIPLGEISLEKLPSLSLPIVLYCRSGQRSEMAARHLLAQDKNLDVYNLEGGILGW